MSKQISLIVALIVALIAFVVVFVPLASATSPGPVPKPYEPWQATWPHLGFDPKDFMCDKFDNLCNVFLDQIDCAPISREVVGCNPDLLNFTPKCKCNGDPIFIDKGSKIANSITDNRIRPEVGWMLEPWNAGPPFDFEESFEQICMLALKRIGCNTTAMEIVIGSKDGTIKNKCACAQVGVSSANNYVISGRIEDLITDKMTEATTMQMPIFEDPIVLNIQLSMAIVFIVGKIFSVVANFFEIPTVIGFILAGMAIMDVVNPGLIKGCGGNGPHPIPFSEFRQLALVILLMRAGLTLKPKEVFGSKDYLMICLAFIPYFSEWACGIGSAVTLLGWSVNDAGLMMSILSSLAPAVVFPGMIKAVNEGFGYVPKIVLTAAPFEVVLSIIMFNIMSSIVQTQPDPVLPWVKVLPLWANIILIPVNISFSCVLGFVVGRPVSLYMNWRKNMSKDEKWGPTLNRILPETSAEYLFICLVLSYLLFALCVKQYIQQSNGILAVFAMMLTISEYGPEDITKGVAGGLAGLWTFIEVILFTSVGCGFSYRPFTGPLQSNRGLSASITRDISKVVFLGSLGRLGGLLVLICILHRTLPKELQNLKSMGMLAVSIYVSQFPKATIQAVLGGLPLSTKIIPGPIGYQRGLFIQQASTLSILVFATCGVALTKFIGLPFMASLRDVIAAGTTATATATATADAKIEYSQVESGDSNASSEVDSKDKDKGKVVEMTNIDLGVTSSASSAAASNVNTTATAGEGDKKLP